MNNPFWAIFLLTLFIVICILLVIVVLLQKGRGGGLGAAFGGAGSAAFGTRTGDVFTWITIVLTGLFLLLAVGSTVLVRPPLRDASTPVFDPKPGSIEEATPVQIACSTPKSKIYYTLDGTKPTKASQEYRKAIIVQPGVTVKAIAMGDELNDSPEADGSYRLKTAEPEPTTLPATTSAPASRPAGGSTSAPAKPQTPASAGAPK
jgi:preprotein translocase subunit SecG